ncbi:MAG: sugar phosphate nucleotidyltransferase [Phycisphaerae bacterium]|nr:sugar phosphate nucleotidyltransferase [Phycisphaerae bacterium]MDD5381378.1 sugar phosphate nucleotidyltransferase [Phycisphaerae bacterium]
MDYVVVMAGGTGKRLWPLSREKHPKQVLKILDGKTLLRHCFERLSPVFDQRNIIIFTNAGYSDLVREDLPELPLNNVVAEPVVRDTAGAIGLAATILTKHDPNAAMAVVTADQLIEPPEVLQQALKDALVFVNNNPDDMITFGIKPTFASTQLGYIKCADAKKYPNCKKAIHAVEAFKEKPDEKTANKYLKTGNYLWNSGMFVWKAKTILANLEKFLPETAEPLRKIKASWDGPNQQSAINEWFPKLPKISIDYAVMEKADRVHAIKLDCRWLDMGSFAALADIITSDKNNNIVVAAMSELLDCKNSIIVTEDKEHLIAVLGLENIVVAHSPDATLVCHVDQAQRLKELLELIKQHTGEKFL